MTRGFEPNLPVFYFQSCSLNWVAGVVANEPPDPTVHLSQKSKQGLPKRNGSVNSVLYYDVYIFVWVWSHVFVFLPVSGEFGCVGVLAAGEFQGDLHAPVPHVVVVLHPPEEWIPLGPIRHAVLESPLTFARPPCRHSLIVGGIDHCQVLESVVVRREGLDRGKALENCKIQSEMLALL